MFNRVCLVAILSFSSFCAHAAKPVNVPMPLAEQLPVELIESQQEIAVTVPQTASAVGMQFGLIGGIIGSAVQNSQAKKAEAAIVPVRDLLVDYRFNQRMHDVLKPKLVSGGISPNPVLSVLSSPWEARDLLQTAQLPPYALVLTPSYAMDSDFAQMTVTLRAQVMDRTLKSNGKVKASSRIGHTYSFHYPLQGARSEDPVQDWVAMGPAALAQLLDQGIAHTTDMLVLDFSSEGRSWWNMKPEGQSVAVAGNLYKGTPVRQGEGWAWVRSGRGVLQTVQGYQPLTAGVTPVLQVASASAPVAAPAAVGGAPVAAVSASAAASVAPVATAAVAVAGKPSTASAAEAPAAAPMPSAPAAAPEAPAAETAPATAPVAPVGG